MQVVFSNSLKEPGNATESYISYFVVVMQIYVRKGFSDHQSIWTDIVIPLRAQFNLSRFFQIHIQFCVYN